MPPRGRSDDHRGVEGQAVQGVGLLAYIRGNRLGHQGRAGRHGQRAEHAVDRAQRDERRHRGGAGEHDRGHRGLGESGREAGGDEHQVARQTIRQYAAEQHEDDVAESPRADHQPEIAR
jgi:hypothetical protein